MAPTPTPDNSSTPNSDAAIPDTIHSSLISELPIINGALFFGLNFKYTEVPKKGLISRIKGTKHPIDLDLSCVLYDKHMEVVDTVWFKQLRDHSETVRHHGDSLNGKDRGDLAAVDRYADIEKIELRLTRIPDNIAHMALLLSSYHNSPIKNVQQGSIYISDDEGNTVVRNDLTKLSTDSAAIMVASLSRELNEWRLTVNNLPLDSPNIKKMTHQAQNELSRFYPVQL